jgi:tRNA nucleotidyltransferase (CCA-adding enzyme)
MHMPPRPNLKAILAGGPSALLERELWSALAPERWPLPLQALPGGTALVGGAVRDALLGRLGERPDLDLVVRGDAVELTRQLASSFGGSCVVLDAGRSIARLVIRGWTIDLARCVGGSLIEDLGRRDYSINAMAVPLRPETEDPPPELPSPPSLVDPHGGVADLRAGRIVAIDEANLVADPLRLLRGIRLATELDFTIAAATWGLIRSHHGRIAGVAGERVLAELLRVSEAPQGHRGLSQAKGLGLLAPWGVPIPADGEADGGTTLARLHPATATAMGLTNEEVGWSLPLARLALTLNGEALRRLHASRRLGQRCRCLRRWWERLCPAPPAAAVAVGQLGETERLRLQQELEADWPALVLLLREDQVPEGALRRWRDPDDPLFHPHAPLDGVALQRGLGIGPGPSLGNLIRHLTRERAFGRLPAGDDRPDIVLATARRWQEREAMRHD